MAIGPEEKLVGRVDAEQRDRLALMGLGAVSVVSVAVVQDLLSPGAISSSGVPVYLDSDGRYTYEARNNTLVPAEQVEWNLTLTVSAVMMSLIPLPFIVSWQHRLRGLPSNPHSEDESSQNRAFLECAEAGVLKFVVSLVMLSSVGMGQLFMTDDSAGAMNNLLDSPVSHLVFKLVDRFTAIEIDRDYLGAGVKAGLMMLDGALVSAAAASSGAICSVPQNGCKVGTTVFVNGVPGKIKAFVDSDGQDLTVAADISDQHYDIRDKVSKYRVEFDSDLDDVTVERNKFLLARLE